ncbi:MAG: efflux RND transporter permease subunit [Bacteroidia bacterium]|nr:efflux RND transporter permease subunit [Bacteroidia bacterium]
MSAKDRKGAIASVVSGAIRYRSIVYMILGMLIVLGIWGLSDMDKDEFPTFELKQGLVAAVYPGADVHQVEEEVGKPLESLLFTFSEVSRKDTKVVSKDGMCYVYVDFTDSGNKDEVWSKIKLKINAFKQTLPPGVLAVVVMDDFSAVSTLLIALESDDKGWSEMKDYADALSDRLRLLPQLASVKLLGTQSEEIAVTLDADRLSAYGLSPASLALDYQTSTLQAPGGSFSTSYAVTPVHVPKVVSDERELADKIVLHTPDDRTLRLADIASVERRYKDPESFIAYNGHTALILSVEMRPDNNIVAFGRDVDRVLEEFMDGAPDSIVISRITDQPKVVGTSVWSFLRDLVISMLVVIAVMLLLFPMRSALIAGSGVPVCTAVALALMYAFGICLNTVSLAALIVVLGMIVDDSVITMDGYMDKLGRGMGRREAAAASAQELFMPMFMATLAISLMFFPIRNIITGYLGDFVDTFPFVIAFSLMTSLAYAILVVPSFEVRYIGSARSTGKGFIAKMQNKMFAGMQNGYEWLQDRCFRHPLITILGGFCAIGLGLLMFTRINVQLMPMASRPQFVVEVYLDPSAGLQQTQAVSDSLSRMLRRDDRVVSVTEFIGSGTPRFHATYAPILPGRNIAQLIVNTASEKATESFLAEWEDYYEFYFPEAQIHFKQMAYQVSSSPVEVLVSGDDYETLRPVAEQIKSFMETVPSLKWVHSDADWDLPSVSLGLKEEEASRMGVNRSLMNLSLAGTLEGIRISSIREGDEEIPVNLYASTLTEDSPYEALGNTLVPSSLPGLSVPVRQVADMTPQWEPERLCRVNGRACIAVGADLKYGQSQPVPMRDVRRFLGTLDVPEGVEISFGGLDSLNGQVGPEIALSFFAAVMILFFFLVFHFKKVSLAVLTIILSSICLFGAFFGLWLFGLEFSMTAVLGLISLVGIIIRNGIIMFEYAEELRFEHGVPVKEAAEEAGKRRMRPIFLTSCTTALGVLPMVISADLLWMPMGVVICFGTLLSMVLITLIMPVSYWLIFRGSDSKGAAETDTDADASNPEASSSPALPSGEV